MSQMFFIQNRMPVGNCVSWWGIDRQGYTCDLSKAGLYTQEQACAIVRGRPEVDKAWPEEIVRRVAVTHVDFQSLWGVKALHVKRRKTHAERPQTTDPQTGQGVAND
jgi:hypothetical protein